MVMACLPRLSLAGYHHRHYFGVVEPIH